MVGEFSRLDVLDGVTSQQDHTLASETVLVGMAGGHGGLQGGQRQVDQDALFGEACPRAKQGAFCWPLSRMRQWGCEWWDMLSLFHDFHVYA